MFSGFQENDVDSVKYGVFSTIFDADIYIFLRSSSPSNQNEVCLLLNEERVEIEIWVLSKHRLFVPHRALFFFSLSYKENLSSKEILFDVFELSGNCLSMAILFYPSQEVKYCTLHPICCTNLL